MLARAKIADKLVGRMANKKTVNLPINVQHVAEASAGIYRVLVSLPYADSRMRKDSEIATAVADKFSNQIAYLSNSFTKTEKPGIYSLYVRGNVPIMTKETASSKKMVEIATNVFKDEGDNIWNLTEDAGTPIFRRADVDDFADILAHARSAHIATASLEIAMSESFTAGNVIVFYDHASQVQRCGIAVTASTVYSPVADTIFVVEPAYVLVVGDEFLNTGEVAAASLSKADVLDYIRKLYGKHSEFYRNYAAMVTGYLGTAPVNN